MSVRRLATVEEKVSRNAISKREECQGACTKIFIFPFNMKENLDIFCIFAKAPFCFRSSRLFTFLFAEDLLLYRDSGS